MMIQNCLKILGEIHEIENLIIEIEKTLEENNVVVAPNLLRDLIAIKLNQAS